CSAPTPACGPPQRYPLSLVACYLVQKVFSGKWYKKPSDKSETGLRLRDGISVGKATKPAQPGHSRARESRTAGGYTGTSRAHTAWIPPDLRFIRRFLTVFSPPGAQLRRLLHLQVEELHRSSPGRVAELGEVMLNGVADGAAA